MTFLLPVWEFKAPVVQEDVRAVTTLHPLPPGEVGAKRRVRVTGFDADLNPHPMNHATVISK